MSPPPALVVGCGYLGSPAARAWRDAGRAVFALTRGRAAELRAQGLTPVVGDVTDADSLAALRDLPPVGTLLYAVGLDRRAGKSMREVYVGGLDAVLRHLPPVDRVIYVSSTSVYGQTGGEWVDGDSVAEPTEDNGRTVLDAERTLRAARPDAVILRFAGIYGPDRVMRKSQLLGGEPYTSDPDKWLNLIHVDDGVRAILAAERDAEHGATLTVSDGRPVTRRAFYTRLADLLGAPAARFEPAGATPGEANRRVRPWAGFEARLAGYEAGLADALVRRG